MGEGGRTTGLPSNSEAALRRAADHAIRYRQGVDQRRIGPAEDYPAMLARFGGPVPETGAPTAEIIDQLAAMADPGLMAFANPRLSWSTRPHHGFCFRDSRRRNSKTG